MTMPFIDLDAIQVNIAAFRAQAEADPRDSMILEEGVEPFRLALRTDMTDEQYDVLLVEERTQAEMKAAGLELESLPRYKASVRKQVNVLFYDPVPDDLLRRLTTGQMEEVIRIASERLALRSQLEVEAQTTAA